MRVRIAVMLIALALVTKYGLSVAGEAQNSGESITPSRSAVTKINRSLCKVVAAMIKDKTISKYQPESLHINPDTTRYPNLDIDGDGKTDVVTISSGSSESLLEVKLSTGREYDLDESPMYLIKFNGKIYAFVRLFDWKVLPDGRREEKNLGHRLYALTKEAAELVCDKDDLK